DITSKSDSQREEFIVGYGSRRIWASWQGSLEMFPLPSFCPAGFLKSWQWIRTDGSKERPRALTGIFHAHSRSAWHRQGFCSRTSAP
ncbi:mCG1048838, partial [Mus musculus]